MTPAMAGALLALAGVLLINAATGARPRIADPVVLALLVLGAALVVAGVTVVAGNA